MASTKRVVFLAVNYAPEPSGTAPYTASAAEYLAERGHDVSVVAGMPHYPNWRIEPRYAGSMSFSEEIAGVRVRRRGHFVPSGQSTLGRALYEVSFALNSLPAMLRRRPDVLITVIPNLLTAVVASFIARLYGARLMLWVQDSMQRASTQSGLATGKALPRLLRRIERRLFRRADKVIAISEGFKKQMLDYGVPLEKLAVMRNWTFIPAPDSPASEVRARLGWQPEEIVVLHAGNMGNKQGLERLVEAAKAATSLNRVRYKFVFAGDGSQRQSLERMAAGFTAIEFIGTLDDQTYANALSAADVLVVCEARGVLDMSLPSKLTSYMSVGKPVVAYVDPRGGTATELRRARAGHVVDNRESPTLLVEALQTIARDAHLREELSAAGKRYARKAYSRLANLEVLAKLVAETEHIADVKHASDLRRTAFDPASIGLRKDRE